MKDESRAARAAAARWKALAKRLLRRSECWRQAEHLARKELRQERRCDMRCQSCGGYTIADIMGMATMKDETSDRMTVAAWAKAQAELEKAQAMVEADLAEVKRCARVIKVQVVALAKAQTALEESRVEADLAEVKRCARAIKVQVVALAKAQAALEESQATVEATRAEVQRRARAITEALSAMRPAMRRCQTCKGRYMLECPRCAAG